MTQLEWVIKVLSENAKEELPKEYKVWLFDNLIPNNIRVDVKDCVCNNLEWTEQEKALLFVQEGEEFSSICSIDTAKPALVLVQKFYEESNTYYLVYWYNPNIEISSNKSKDKKLGCKIKRLNLPTFEEWKQKDYVDGIKYGAYRVEIRAVCWGNGRTTYGFAMSLANCNPLNVYTDRLFSGLFEYDGDLNNLKQWYDSIVATFYDFWDEYISKLYLESNV